MGTKMGRGPVRLLLSPLWVKKWKHASGGEVTNSTPTQRANYLLAGLMRGDLVNYASELTTGGQGGRVLFQIVFNKTK